MNKFIPDNIYLDHRAKGFPLAQKVLDKLSSVPVVEIAEVSDFLDEYRSVPRPLSRGKRALLLTLQKGNFVKPCPCTPCYMGCNYFIINTDTHCPLDCSYCILQLYLDNPLITVHVNTDDLERELDAFIGTRKSPFRIGSGELGDSLVLDHITNRAALLIRYFRRHESAILELKTKSVNIEGVMKENPSENIVLAWSLNSLQASQNEESGAPSIQARLDAARTVCERGYRVAFHFDPIIRHENWDEGYRETVALMLESVPAARIAWISLGSLRYPSDLKTIIQTRFPGSRIVYEEMIRGNDGKQRYFKPLRREMYAAVAGYIKEYGGQDIPIYFCMESPDIWENILNKKPRNKEHIEECLTLSRG